MKVIDWYSKFNGEPEIQLRCYDGLGLAETTVRIWEGYFNNIMFAIKPMKEKWGELTLPFHTCSGWYDSVEWTIIHVDEAILELKSIDTQDIEDVERQILQELIEMFEYAYKHKARLTISCA